MTALLQKAFAEAAKLPEPEQEVRASRLLAELATEDEFDQAIARSSDKLAILAREALAEHRAGKTEPLDSVNKPRAGWAAALQKMAQRGDDGLLDAAAPSLSRWDEDKRHWR